MRRSAFAGVVLALAARTAIADPATGARLQAEGEALAANHDFVGATAKFRAAYAADPRPELICDVGVAYFKQPDLPRAQRYLKQCIDAGASLEAGFLARITTALHAAEDALARGNFTPVDFLIQPASALIHVDGWTEDALAPARRAWLPFGHYTLTIHAEGFIDKSIALVAADRTVQVVGVALDPAPVAPTPTPTPTPTSTPTPPPTPTPTPAPTSPPPSRVPAIAATAGTVVLAAAGTLLYLSARGKVTDAGAASSLSDYNQDVSAVHVREGLAFGLWAATGAGVVASAYLWHRASRVPVIELAPTPGGAAVSLRGRF